MLRGHLSPGCRSVGLSRSGIIPVYINISIHTLEPVNGYVSHLLFVETFCQLFANLYPVFEKIEPIFACFAPNYKLALKQVLIDDCWFAALMSRVQGRYLRCTLAAVACVPGPAGSNRTIHIGCYGPKNGAVALKQQYA